MEGFDPKGFAEILGLPGTLVPTVLMPIGYASSVAPEKLRFPLDELFIEHSAGEVRRDEDARSLV